MAGKHHGSADQPYARNRESDGKILASIARRGVVYGNNIYLRDGINPANLDYIDGLVFLAHEFAHSVQADMAGSAVHFGALYLSRSATVHLQGKDAYEDNHYEVQAREF